MRKGFVFDLDGTLVDSHAGVATSFARALREAGFAEEAESTQVRVGPPLAKMIDQALPSAPDVVRVEIAKRFRDHYDRVGVTMADPYPGVTETLKGLHVAGSTLVLLTNKRQGPAEAIIARNGWRGLFTAVSGAADCGAVEQAVQKLERAAALVCELGNEQVVVVGDGLDDWHTAEHLGARFLLAAWGYGTADVLQAHPHAEQLAAFSELPTKLGISLHS